jgi:hypothetical protein
LHGRSIERASSRSKRGAEFQLGNENRREFIRHAGAALAGLNTFQRLSAGAFSGVSERNAAVTGQGSAQSSHPAPRQRMRGLMVDAARLPESPEYYRRVIEFCAEWDLNTLHFRLTDDQGSALRFASVPDIVTHPDALTSDEVKSLVDFAGSHGIDLIPEVESFGHTGYITRSPTYAHLLDADPHGSSEFTGVIPVLSETGELFEKLYREVAALFPSAYLHAGCDEVNWGGSSLSRTALKSRSRAQIWAEYLNSLHRTAEILGKQLIVWGDFILHKEPQILAQLNKNVIIMDWNYWDTRAIGFHDALIDVEKSGHRGIGAPGLISYRWGPRAGTEQLRNIDAFTEAYFAADDPGSLGVILTNWVPTRYIQDSLWDGFAYAAVAFKNGPAVARVSAFRSFVERHYRAEWNELWTEAFELIYAAAPSFGEGTAVSPMGLRLATPWSSDAQLAEVLNKRSRPTHSFTRLRSLLVELEPGVLRNLSDFHAFSLSVECLELLFWREATVVEHAAQAPLDPEATKLLIQTIADRDRDLVESLSVDWDKGRSRGSAAKRELIFALESKDQLLYQWNKAADYSSSLALHPDRFHQLLGTTTRS